MNFNDKGYKKEVISKEYEEFELNSFIEDDENFMGKGEWNSFIKAETNTLEWIMTVESIANDQTLTPNSK